MRQFSSVLLGLVGQVNVGRGVAACFGKGQGAMEGASQAWPL